MAANAYRRDRLPAQRTNSDEDRYGDRRASFCKTLPQNDLGEVEAYAYADLLAALRSGNPNDFEAIPQAAGAAQRLVNPQCAYAFELTGLDGHATRIDPPPRFASAHQAAEMGEVYWHSLTRDVPFRAYDADADIQAAIDDLNGFSKTVGPRRNGAVTPDTLFRGETPGDLIGPFLSQFLWLDIPYGLSTIVQAYDPPVRGLDFCIDYEEWLAIQRGVVPSRLKHVGTRTYLNNNRALGEFVHQDVSFQAYLNAALIMFGFGLDALAPGNPYLDSHNQEGFGTFGLPAIADLVTKAARVALTGAWYQKWLVHRRLRPEVFAARIENQANGTKHYGINAEIIESAAVDRLFVSNGNRLLPLAFPEGSPTHPSYPAGHASMAGACCTILKAFFNEQYPVPNPVEATADGSGLDAWLGPELTLGNEINKLANNISLGRDAAGVHYRSDGVNGLLVGEQQALGILQDYSRTYSEDFDGFSLTRFDGTPVRIRNGRVLRSRSRFARLRRWSGAFP